MSSPLNEISVAFYRGRSGPFARTAAYWLSRLHEWEGQSGPIARQGIALCRRNHGRCVQAARSHSGGAR